MDGGIKIAASLNPQGAYPADIRQTPVATVGQLLNWDFAETPIPEGHEILCLADGIKYEYRSTNNEPASGKFKAPTSGGEIPDNSIAEVKLDEGVKTKLNKTFKTINGQSILGNGDIPTGFAEQIRSEGIFDMVNHSNLDPTTWTVSTSDINEEGNVIMKTSGSGANFIRLTTPIEVGKKYIAVVNITSLNWLSEYCSGIDFVFYTTLLSNLSIRRSEQYDYLLYQTFTPTAAGTFTISALQSTSGLAAEIDLVSFNVGFCAVVEYSEKIEQVLKYASLNYRGGTILTQSTLLSIGMDEDFQESINKINGIVNVNNNVYSEYITRWTSVTTAAGVINDFVNVIEKTEIEGDYINVLKFGGSTNVTENPTARMWTGFRFNRDWYWATYRRLVIIIQGSCYGENVSNILWRGSTDSDLDSVVDLNNDNELMEFTYIRHYIPPVKLGTAEYSYLFPRRRDDNISDISFNMNIIKFGICEYVEGYTDEDYLLQLGKYVAQPKYYDKSISTKTYVNNSIVNNRQLNNNSINPTYDVEMLLSGGQSLNVGAGAATIGNEWDNTLVFAGGSNIGSTIPFNTEAEKIAFWGNELELIKNDTSKENYPPITASINTILTLFRNENYININDFNFNLMPLCWGLSGSSIDNISKGTKYYTDMIESVTKAKELANNVGKTFGVRCMNWYQGESNSRDTKQQYYDKLVLLFNNVNTDVKNITGQIEDVQFFTYQTSPWLGEDIGNGYLETNINVQEAQLQVVKDMDNVHLCGAMYQFAYADAFHPTDRAVVGLQTGVAMKRVLYDNAKWNDFIPISHKLINNGSTYFIHLKFSVPEKPMRFDVSGDAWHNPNGKQPNFGFKVLLDGTDIISAEPFVTSGDTVVIPVAANPENAIIQYATNGHFGGGNLCDSQNIVIFNKGVDYVIDNFAAAFSEYVVS